MKKYSILIVILFIFTIKNINAGDFLLLGLGGNNNGLSFDVGYGNRTNNIMWRAILEQDIYKNSDIEGESGFDIGASALVGLVDYALPFGPGDFIFGVGLGFFSPESFIDNINLIDNPVGTMYEIGYNFHTSSKLHIMLLGRSSLDLVNDNLLDIIIDEKDIVSNFSSARLSFLIPIPLSGSLP